MRESRKRKAISYAESTSGDGSDEDAASSEAEEMNSDESESDESMDADGSSDDELDADEDDDVDIVGSDDDSVKPKGKGKQSAGGASKNKKSAPKAPARTKSSPARVSSALTSATSKKSPANSSRTIKTAATVGTSNNQGPSSVSAPGVASSAVNVTTATSSGVDITQGPPITTDAGAKKLVTQYMRQQNRPYSAQQMFDNLHKRIPKATLERVLGVLSGPGEGLLCKEYGKAKIYYVDQSFLPAERSAEQLQDLQQSVLELQDELKVQLQEEKDKKQLLQARRAEPDDSELDRMVQELEERIRVKRQKIESLQAGKVSGPPMNTKKGSKPSGPMNLEQATQQYNLKRKAWVERKALCMNAIDVLSEALSKKRQEVLTMLDIETDEACGAVLPPKL